MFLKDKITFLKQKSELINQCRVFFLEKGYWEAETPIISRFASIEEHIDSVPAYPLGDNKQSLYLVTSPEYFMKRLIAHGAGDCFQISKVFRQCEIGDLHNPEFTMLEWYKMNCDTDQLIDEIDELISLILKTKGHQKITYHDLFRQYTDVELDEFTLAMLPKLAGASSAEVSDQMVTKQEGVDYVFSFLIQPQLGWDQLLFVTDFPKDQASLALINMDGKTAQRFEAFYRGVELCNGYAELVDSDLLSDRFDEINQKRAILGKNTYEPDHELLNDLKGDFPPCCGVALGLDRLIMLALKQEKLSSVLAFPLEN